MKYRRLARTGLQVSVIGVGTWQLSGQWGRRFTQHEVDELLGRARDLGVNLVDTAECYGDHLAEALVGQAIHQQRDDWVVATKFGHQFHPEAMQYDRWSPVAVRSDHWTPTEVIEQLEASLRALRSDHVDIYQFHSGPEQAFDQDGLWETLHQQVAKGTVRHLGVSLGSNANVYQARRAADVGRAWSRSATTDWTRPPSRGSCRSAWTKTWGARPRAAGQRLPQRQVPARHPDHRQRRLAFRARPGRGATQARAGGPDPAD